MKKYLSVIIALIFFCGCSVFNTDDELSQVKFSLANNSSYSGELPLRINMKTTNLEKVLTASDFEKPNASNTIGPFSTASSGLILVTAELLDQQNVAVTSTTIELPLKPDWRYGITIAIGPDNPFFQCFGCQDYQSIPISDELAFSESDTLYLVWGRNSISQPVDY